MRCSIGIRIRQLIVSLLVFLSVVAVTVEAAIKTKEVMKTEKRPTTSKSWILHNDAILNYRIHNGLAIYQDDIILGYHDDLQKNGIKNPLFFPPEKNHHGQSSQHLSKATMVSVSQWLWSDGIIPYMVSDKVSANTLTDIMEAMKHWQARTKIRFVERSNENNYVEFIRDGGCYSWIGMVGGRQELSLVAGCPRDAAIHELGHAIGFFHEQSRIDRDMHITINWDNITEINQFNFNVEHFSTAYEDYDFYSIMHYWPYSFSVNFEETTLEPIDDSVAIDDIGVSVGLSRGDVIGTQELYGTASGASLSDCEEPVSRYFGYPQFHLSRVALSRQQCIPDNIYPAGIDHEYTDRFKVNVYVDANLTVALEESQFDSFITITDVSGVEIVAQSALNGVRNPTVTVNLAADNYLVYISSTNAGEGNYRLILDNSPESCIHPVSFLNLNGETDASLSQEDCFWDEVIGKGLHKSYTDRYSINITEESMLDVQMNGQYIDAYLVLYDPVTEQRVANSSCAYSNSNSISTRLAVGEYLLWVGSCPSEYREGNYTLSVATTSPDNWQQDLYLAVDLNNIVDLIAGEDAEDTYEVRLNLRDEKGVLSSHTERIFLAANERLSYTQSDLQQLFADVWANNKHVLLTATADEPVSLLNKVLNDSEVISNTNCVAKNSIYQLLDSAESYVKLINTTDKPRTFIRATLYDEDGKIIGVERSIIVDRLESYGSLWVSGSAVATAIGTSWHGAATLVLHSVLDGIHLQNINMDSGSALNFSCGQNNHSGNPKIIVVNPQLNVESEVHIINSSDETVDLYGTFYQNDGNVTGEVDQLIVSQLLPHARYVFSASEINDWTFNALSQMNISGLLEIYAAADITVFNQLRHSNNIVSDISCTAQSVVDAVEAADSSMESFIAIVNKSDTLSSPTLSLDDSSSNRIVSASSVLPTIPANGHTWISREWLDVVLQLGSDDVLRLSLSDHNLQILNINFSNGVFVNFSCAN